MSAVSIPTSGTGAASGGAQTLAKATAMAMITVDPSALLFSSPKPATPALRCRYNPKSLSITGGTQWQSSDTAEQLGPPTMQFKHTKPRTLSVELLVDLFFLPYGNVDWELKALQDWCEPRSNPVGQVSAPYLRFQWGESRYFKCVLESYSITHTMFSKTGAPMRANVQVTLKEVLDALPFTNPTSGGLGGERSHVVRVGDSLHSIATAYYGRPGLWRGLAAFNDVDDPRRVGTGDVLAIPDVDVASDLS